MNGCSIDVKNDDFPEPESAADISAALRRARRVAANLTDPEDQRVMERYIAELEGQEAACRSIESDE